jgi:hypothetical protein
MRSSQTVQTLPLPSSAGIHEHGWRNRISSSSNNRAFGRDVLVQQLVCQRLTATGVQISNRARYGYRRDSSIHRCLLWSAAHCGRLNVIRLKPHCPTPEQIFSPPSDKLDGFDMGNLEKKPRELELCSLQADN